MFDKKRDEAILEFCNNKKVLDIGAVGGQASEELSLHKKIKTVSSDVLGLDKKPSKEKKIIRGDAENFDLGEIFEVLVAADIIEHLSNPGKFLESCKKHMDKKSTLLITTPNLHSLYNLKRKIFHSRGVSDYHKLGFTKKLLKQLLISEGFKIEKIEMVLFWEGSPSFRYFVSKLIPSKYQTTILCSASKNINFFE